LWLEHIRNSLWMAFLNTHATRDGEASICIMDALVETSV
jgi:hypothetical protein